MPHVTFIHGIANKPDQGALQLFGAAAKAHGEKRVGEFVRTKDRFGAHSSWLGP